MVSPGVLCAFLDLGEKSGSGWIVVGLGVL
jgi:hypothetical protein